MTPIDRLRSADRRWYVFGGGLMVLAVLLGAVLVKGDESPDELTGADATPSVSASSPSSSTNVTSTVARDEVASTAVRPTSSTITTTRVPVTVPGLDDYELDIDEDVPGVVARPAPAEVDLDEPPPTTIAPPPWAASTMVTAGGHLGTDVGCARDLSAASLDRFLAARVGPVLGWDYQHVYPLGGDRYLWIFQDAFLDHTGTVDTLGSARFVHNAALVQQGVCFELLHGGSTNRPDAFEVGDGSADLRTKWYWPMGGELVDGELWMFWAEMIKDPYDPDPPDGLGWHPQRTFLASYDAATLRRTSFLLAPNSGVAPIYGYAVSSDNSHTYLFGNTFEQNLLSEGGFWTGPHSATDMWLARVPRGRLAAVPEYRTVDGWSSNPADAVPIVSRFWAENPMQPRYLDGQWVAATAVDGYWGDHLAVDVAPNAWGPWTTVQYSPLPPRNDDPKMNTYHAQPLPWRDGYGSVLITVSNNARDMRRDAWNDPYRYRPTVIYAPYHPTPAPPVTAPITAPPTSTSVPATTPPASSSTSTSTSSTTTTSSSSTSSTTTSMPASTTTSTSTSSTTTTSSSSTTSTTTGSSTTIP